MKIIGNTKVLIKPAQYIPKVWGMRQLMLTILLFSFAHSSLAASQAQSLEKIRLAAKKFLEEKQVAADKDTVEVKVGYLDNRLRLANCGENLETFLPQKSRSVGKITVGIRCPGPVNWKVFIQAEVIFYQQAWIAKRNLRTSDVLTRNDLIRQKVAVSDTRKMPIADIGQLINTSPKRNLRTGTALYQGSVCLVCRGDTVTVSARNALLSIDVEGVALNDAVLGEQVQIRNTSSKKVFAATVTGKNQLKVNITGSR